jgi:hypothetical protein
MKLYFSLSYKSHISMVNYVRGDKDEKNSDCG